MTEPQQQIDPQTPGTITGYRKHDQAAIDAVNHSKDLENEVGEWINRLASGGVDGVTVDPRWLSIAITHLQQGFMAVNRAVFQPESRLGPVPRVQAENREAR